MVEDILENIGAKVKVKEVKKLRREEGKKEIIWVRLGDEEQKKKVMEKKNRLKGRKERILEDWTWKERRMRWKLKEIARKEMSEEKCG